MKKKAVIYIHGKGGNAAESEHYKQFFPQCEVIGFDYTSQTPWEAEKEFGEFFDSIGRYYSSIILIANSIGAYFAMNASKTAQLEKAYFISPIVNMEKLITDMMLWAGVTQTDLKEKGIIETAFGETLSWEYLSWIRNHPVSWSVPTFVLYGSADNL
ncbi:MAG: alpha/beta hydrolase, partial [Eubacteriales bacterium]|nr:alpha/beta hydrolase [Eubacteriales bacterium]